MPQNDIKIIKKRSKILREVAKKRKDNHIKKLVGKTIEVFVEKNNRGYSSQFAPVKLLGKKIESGQKVLALIKMSDKDFAYGEII